MGTARDPDFGIHAVGWENGSIRDLGTMSVYPSARAFAVNDRGQVVGDGDVLPLGNHLFFWDKGTTFDIPQSGGPIGSLFAVNDSGAAVGYTTLDENFTTRAILVKRVRP